MNRIPFMRYVCKYEAEKGRQKIYLCKMDGK